MSQEKSPKSITAEITNSLVAVVFLILIGFFIYIIWWRDVIIIKKDGETWSCPADADPAIIDKFLSKAKE